MRDVVRAYRLLAERAEPGVYNICSGRTASSRELVAMLGEAAGVAVDHVVDPAKLRPHEVMELRGSFEALRAATGWEPEIPLAQTLGDTSRVVAGFLTDAPPGGGGGGVAAASPANVNCGWVGVRGPACPNYVR